MGLDYYSDVHPDWVGTDVGWGVVEGWAATNDWTPGEAPAGLLPSGLILVDLPAGAEAHLVVGWDCEATVPLEYDGAWSGFDLGWGQVRGWSATNDWTPGEAPTALDAWTSGAYDQEVVVSW